MAVIRWASFQCGDSPDTQPTSPAALVYVGSTSAAITMSAVSKVMGIQFSDTNVVFGSSYMIGG